MFFWVLLWNRFGFYRLTWAQIPYFFKLISNMVLRYSRLGCWELCRSWRRFIYHNSWRKAYCSPMFWFCSSEVQPHPAQWFQVKLKETKAQDNDPFLQLFGFLNFFAVQMANFRLSEQKRRPCRLELQRKEFKPKIDADPKLMICRWCQKFLGSRIGCHFLTT